MKLSYMINAIKELYYFGKNNESDFDLLEIFVLLPATLFLVSIMMIYSKFQRWFKK